MRTEVNELVALGPMPCSQAEEEKIKAFEAALLKLELPLTSVESTALLSSFGDDDCFGLAWTLIHAIESSPEFKLNCMPPADANKWLVLLWERQCNTT